MAAIAALLDLVGASRGSDETVKENRERAAERARAHTRATGVQIAFIDFDGTLVNTVRALFDSCQEVARLRGVTFDIPWEQYLTWLTSADYMDRFHETFRSTGDGKVDERRVMEEVADMVDERCWEDRSLVFPGVRESLFPLMRRYTLVLISHSDAHRGWRRLAATGLQGSFRWSDIHFTSTPKHVTMRAVAERVVTRHNATYRGEMPVTVEETLRRSCYIGDSVGDMQDALLAGVTPIGVATGVSSRVELAEYGVVFDSFSEATAALRQ